MAASHFLGLAANGGFRFLPPAAMGTLPSCNQAKAERQKTEWTGRWRCLYHQSAISLEESSTQANREDLRQRRFQAVNGQSEFWGADHNYANAMSRGFDDERRLTEAKRPLTSPPTLKEVESPFGHGEHPLPHRQRRENVIVQARRCFGHAPRVAGGAHASTFAGIGDQEIVVTLGGFLRSQDLKSRRWSDGGICVCFAASLLRLCRWCGSSCLLTVNITSNYMINSN
jgi:hypothetical protein